MISNRSLAGNLRTLLLILLERLSLQQHLPGYADPLTVGWVETDDIEYVTGRRDANNYAWADAGLVLDGDWDESARRFEDESEWYSALYQRFVEGADWSDIAAIQRRIEMVERGETVMDGRETIQGVYDRCELMDAIYEDIAQNGYRTQPELLEADRGTPYDKLLPYKSRYHEVAVDVARDGELLFVDGRHRLSFAKLLDVDRIPVRIVVRHAEFERDETSLFVDSLDVDYGHPLLPI